jgi:hypothetical protein
MTFRQGQTLTAGALNAEFALVAFLDSPSLTGVPTTPTAAVSTNTSQIASTAFVLANAGSPATFVFAQATPSASWSIAHNLNRFPSVVVVDSSGRMVEGDVTYVDANNVSVGFAAGFSGTAYLN